MIFDFRVIWDNLNFLLLGLAATLRASGLAMVLALVIGTILGIAGASRVRLFQIVQQTYSYIIRGIPLLVFLFMIFFALPLVGLELSAFVAGVLALAINSGAYVSEVVRAGIESIEPEQWEASALDGAVTWQTLVYILLPQTLQRVTAGTTNELISLIKGSSLLAVIAVFELTRAAQIVASREFAPFEMYSASAVIYLLIVSALIRISYTFEHRIFAG